MIQQIISVYTAKVSTRSQCYYMTLTKLFVEQDNASNVVNKTDIFRVMSLMELHISCKNVGITFIIQTIHKKRENVMHFSRFHIVKHIQPGKSTLASFPELSSLSYPETYI